MVYEKFRNLSEDELGEMIAQKYGEDWSITDVDEDDELVIEFFDRVSRGI